MATMNRKTRNQLNLNSKRIRFDVKYTKIKMSVFLISNKSQIYFKRCFFNDNDKLINGRDAHTTLMKLLLKNAKICI